jgi:long-chain acyl-CoA synthetase
VTIEPNGPAAGARAAARLAKQVEVALDDVDLSLPQYRVLAFLSEGSAAASAMAGTLAVSRPTVTVVVDGLVAKGLVERRSDEADRRRVHHRLTEQGERALERADDAVAAKLAEIAGVLGPSKATRAREALVLWGEALIAARQAARIGS